MPRKSSVELLDPTLKEVVDRLLREGHHTLDDIVAQVNALAGGAAVSHSGVGRYSKRMSEVGERIRQRRQIEEQWIGKLGETAPGRAGRLLTEVVRQLVWDAATDLADGEETVDPRLIRELASSVRQLQRSERESLDFDRALELELERRAKLTADSVDKVITSRGVTESTADALREALTTVAG